MSQNLCLSCRWWMGDRKASEAVRAGGDLFTYVAYQAECRLGPPIGRYEGGYSPPGPIWPRTNFFDWCGQWTALLVEKTEGGL